MFATDVGYGPIVVDPAPGGASSGATAALPDQPSEVDVVMEAPEQTDEQRIVGDEQRQNKRGRLAIFGAFGGT